jgi:hypothetical protein
VVAPDSHRAYRMSFIRSPSGGAVLGFAEGVVARKLKSRALSNGGSQYKSKK